MYYEDYWDEPSEYECMIEDLKDKLRESVRQEIKDEIDSLQEKVAELKDVQDNWDEKLQEVEDEKHKYWQASQNAERAAKSARLVELMESIEQEAWTASGEHKYIFPKCDKCDENRQIHFKSPSGRDLAEECECAKRKYIYSPKPLKVYKIHQRTRKNGKPDDPWVYYMGIERYGMYPDEIEDDIELINIKLGEKERRDRWHSCFFSKEDCQRYCDELNSEDK